VDKTIAGEPQLSEVGFRIDYSTRHPTSCSVGRERPV
jgi:hypothetical protein